MAGARLVQQSVSSRIAIASLALGALAATGVALAARAAIPRLEHRRVLAAAIDEARQAHGRCDEARARRAIEHLVDFDDAAVIVALVDLYANPTIHERPVRDALERAVELFATTPEPRDPRPAAALAAFVATHSAADVDRRFEAFEHLEEFAQPRFPIEPSGFDDRVLKIDGSFAKLEDLIAPIAPASSVPIELGEHAGRLVFEDGGWARQPFSVSIADRPYRALVRLVQDAQLALVFERGVLRVVDCAELYPRHASFERPGAPYDVYDRRETGCLRSNVQRWSRPLAEELASAGGRELVIVAPAAIAMTPTSFRFTDPLKALRALAALNGCSVRERDAKTLELVR